MTSRNVPSITLNITVDLASTVASQPKGSRHSAAQTVTAREGSWFAFNVAFANGSGDVVSIRIAKEIVDPEDVEFLEEAVLSGVKQAIAQGKELAQSEMTKITGGLGLGGLGL